MNRKPTLLAAALAIAGGALAFAPTAGAVQSPLGTITFNGRIVGNTCIVQITGTTATGSASTAGGAGTGTVTLPTVYTTAFSGVGSAAGSNTPFAISLTGCDSSFTSAQTLWQPGGNLSAAGGRLSKTGNSTVDVQLLNAGGTAMDLSQGTATGQGSQSVTFGTGANAGTATLNYSAQYYATAATVNAGAVSTSTQFTVIYQ